MPLKFKWCDSNQSIIQIDIYEKITWDEWYETLDDVYAEIEKVSHRVDMIFNATVGMPDNNPIPHIRNVMKKFDSYKHLEKIVLVNSTKELGFVKAVMEIVSQAMNVQSDKHGMFKSSVEEALDFIEKDRQM